MTGISPAPWILEVSREDFADKVLQRSAEVPVVVDFWAGWCAPCQTLMPILQKLAEEYQGKFVLAKVNSDEQQELAREYGIRSLPTVLVIRHGEIVDRFMGAQPEGAIRRIIEPYLERASDKLRTEALACLALGDTGRALILLESAHRADPENHGVTLDLADLALLRNDPDAAHGFINALPLEQRQSEAAKALLARAAFMRDTRDTPDISVLEQRIKAHPDDIDSRYRCALRRILAGAPAQGMEELLEIMRRDRKFADDGARRGLLTAFDLLYDQPVLVNGFRRRMASLLH